MKRGAGMAEPRLGIGGGDGGQGSSVLRRSAAASAARSWSQCARFDSLRSGEEGFLRQVQLGQERAQARHAQAGFSRVGRVTKCFP